MTEAKLAANRRNSFFRKCGGYAPDAYRCQTIKKRTGQRCVRWRCRGSKFCRKHGGLRMLGDRRGRNPKLVTNRRVSALQGRNMPAIYRYYLSRTLSDALRESLNTSPSEQLFEELALAAHAAIPAVQLFDLAMQDSDADPTNMEKKKTAIEAGMLLQKMLKEVAIISRQAAEVDAQSKDKISIYALRHFVDQLVIIAHDTWGDDPRVEKFREAVRDRVKIPNSASDIGTDQLPSDVAAMDASVPRIPE